MAHFVDHSSVPSTQLTDGLKVVILQLTHLSLLGEEGFETLPLLLIQVQLPELLLQGFQIRSNQQVKKKNLYGLIRYIHLHGRTHQFDTKYMVI